MAARPLPADAGARPALFRGKGAVPFDADAAIAGLSRADPVLGRLIARVGPFGLELHEAHDPFQALVEAIVYQQLTGRAAATIVERVKARFAPASFPAPEALVAAPEASLRAAGLSRAKMVAIQDLAARAISGQIPTLEELAAMADEEIVARLSEVRGVGRWTVEMLLIFRLGRPDVLPVTDYGVRKGFTRVFRRRELATPREVAARGERWAPFRSVASWYLWRALELPAKPPRT